MARLTFAVGALAVGIGCRGSTLPSNDGAATTGAAEAPAEAAPWFSVEGYTLGDPEAEVKARVPKGTEWKEVDGSRQAELMITWRGRPAKLTLAVRGGWLYSLSLVTYKEDAAIEDVRTWAETVCAEAAPNGQRVVAWPAPTSRRYAIPFKQAAAVGSGNSGRSDPENLAGRESRVEHGGSTVEDRTAPEPHGSTT